MDFEGGRMGRGAPTFRVRGRMSAARQRAVAAHGARFAADLTAWSPTVVDIGFGSGESLVWLAERHPTDRILGIEMHEPGVATALDALAAGNHENVRILRADALDVLQRIGAESLSLACVLHPDPWPKQRQAHRRLVQIDVVAAITDRLQPGGLLVLATDDARYAHQMRGVATAEPRLINAEPPELPDTRYAARGRAAGCERTTLAYRRQVDSDA